MSASRTFSDVALTTSLSLRTLKVAMNGAYSPTLTSSSGIDHPADLGVTLKRPSRLFVDINDLAIRVTREVHANLDYNFGHLLVNLGL